MSILQPPPKSLKELLRDRKYRVPLYQRAFSWGEDEAKELWDDLTSNEPPYFLGILLLRKREEKGEGWFEVVDGQQRLATLMLLLRAAVEVLKKNKEGKEDRRNLQLNFITQKEFGREESNFTLTLNNRDNDKFKTLLNDKTEYLPPKGTRSTASWKNLEETKKVFKEEFSRLVKAEGVDGLISFIKNRVLKISMIDVQLEDDSDVYVFFETLNDRGIDLSLADLVKNRVCALPRINTYEASSKIDKVTDLLGTGKMKPFLLHYCWALTEDDPPPPSKKLMNWYKRIILSEGKKFLTNLDRYSQLYVEIIEPRKTSSRNKEVLTFLKVLGATRCYPVLLVGREHLSQKDFLRLCRAIEILTVRHSTISRKDAKKLEVVYQRLAKDIRNGVDIENVTKKLKSQSQDIDDGVFKANFDIYSPPNTQIARYLLFKIENYLQEDTIPADWEKLTLEHILAKGADWEGNIEFKERLGNMALLSGKLNVKLSNLPFKSKRKEYGKETNFEFTYNLADYSDFTKDTIIDRQKELSKYALQVWSPDIIK